MSSGCPIDANPDIVGIGTRINFYATILLISLIPECELTTELLDGLYENSVFFGFGLVISAVVQTARHQLDLYHAIFVVQIIFSLDFVYAYGIRRASQDIKRASHSKAFRAKFIVLVQMISTAMFTVWVLYVWAQNAHLGPKPDCNHAVKYVFFFFSVPATATPLRTLFIAFIVFAAFSLLFKFSTIVFVTMERFEEQYLSYARDAKSSGTGKQSKLKNVLRVSVGSAIYGVTTLELIVQRNRAIVGPGEGDWGFGQILALILVLQSVVDSVVTFQEWRRKEGRHSESSEVFLTPVVVAVGGEGVV